MMVQLQNADRLTEIITFGTVNQAIDDDGFPITDENGLQTDNFKQIGTPSLCGRWHWNTTQAIQAQGLNRVNSFMIVCHHRRSWDGITHAKMHDVIYEVTEINQDSFQNPTAYDQLILSKVGERNG